MKSVNNEIEGRLNFRALLIEADEAYDGAIAACMAIAGCDIQHVTDIDLALPALDRNHFDVVVWGVPIPDPAHRNESIAELRLHTDAPLVLVAVGFDTAQGDLEAGADQRLPKPFVPGALVGAVRAALRRSKSPTVPLALHLEIRGMALDGNARTLTFNGADATFTRQEWSLLSILMEHPNRYLTAREILHLGWHAGDYGPQEVRIYMRRVRKKIEPLDLPCGLLSRHGYGYCLAFQVPAS
jgi:DNA-binding response OmpR family regulator